MVSEAGCSGSGPCRPVFGITYAKKVGAEGRSGKLAQETSTKSGRRVVAAYKGAAQANLTKSRASAPRHGRPPGLLPPAGPCLALKGVRGAESGRQGVGALPAPLEHN